MSAIAKQATISQMEEFSASHEEKQEFIGTGNDFPSAIPSHIFLRNSVFVIQCFSRHLTFSVSDWNVVLGPTVYLARVLDLMNFWWSSKVNSRLAAEVFFRLSLIFDY
jgi:hypothetical protein